MFQMNMHDLDLGQNDILTTQENIIVAIEGDSDSDGQVTIDLHRLLALHLQQSADVRVESPPIEGPNHAFVQSQRPADTKLRVSRHRCVFVSPFWCRDTAVPLYRRREHLSTTCEQCLFVDVNVIHIFSINRHQTSVTIYQFRQFPCACRHCAPQALKGTRGLLSFLFS